jgi:hypothetical protein
MRRTPSMRSLFDANGEPVQEIACNHCGERIACYTRDDEGAIRHVTLFSPVPFSESPPYHIICPSRSCRQETDILALDYFDWQEYIEAHKTGTTCKFTAGFAAFS